MFVINCSCYFVMFVINCSCYFVMFVINCSCYFVMFVITVHVKDINQHVVHIIQWVIC